MNDETPKDQQIRQKQLSPEAKRALAEAQERRELAANGNSLPEEFDGRGGEDPARFGDWEVNGRAIDF